MTDQTNNKITDDKQITDDNNVDQTDDAESQNNSKKVIIYSTPTCHYCALAKEYFTKNNIAYTEFNVAENPVARMEMIQKTGQLGVPVIQIGEEVVIGFTEPHIRALLEA